MRDDKGSTIPLYVWLVGMLLFAAFVFFVFAKGAVARNGAQSAADAAALAAAQEVRDELRLEFIAGLPTGAWVLPLEGKIPSPSNGLPAAQHLAAENDSTVQYVHPTFVKGDLAYKARIQTNYTVGDSLVPGTEAKRAHADATAVIEPRCHMVANVPGQTIEFFCDGSGLWVIDPKTFNAGDLPTAQELYEVNLAE
ncbi:pilus assembly protein TadG-related protein [Streptomyces indicus]|uniref:pilus assembly protein TadG-related protein n=1 Tax=Streptomyces indicus TaxID=417292 RepID=UPI001FE29DED|nr:pilus assembly protein TadG-related protein [Streptomyces indicus]